MTWTEIATAATLAAVVLAAWFIRRCQGSPPVVDVDPDSPRAVAKRRISGMRPQLVVIDDHEADDTPDDGVSVPGMVDENPHDVDRRERSRRPVYVTAGRDALRAALTRTVDADTARAALSAAVPPDSHVVVVVDTYVRAVEARLALERAAIDTVEAGRGGLVSVAVLVAGRPIRGVNVRGVRPVRAVVAPCVQVRQTSGRISAAERHRVRRWIDTALHAAVPGGVRAIGWDGGVILLAPPHETDGPRTA